MWDVWEAPGHQGEVGEGYWGALVASMKGQLEEPLWGFSVTSNRYLQEKTGP